MEEKKMPTWLVILLIVVGLCLVGFGIWYGVNYSKNLGEPEGPTPEPSTEEPTETRPVGEKIDFPQKSDDNVVIGSFYELITESELKTNFKNLKKEVNGNILTFNCEKYVTEDKECATAKLTINDEFSIEEDVPYALGSYDVINIYKVNNYYVVVTEVEEGGFDLNYLTIYDKSKKVYETKVKSTYWLKDLSNPPYSYDENNYVSVKPVIVNNTLHFVEQINSDIEDVYIKMKYNTIDLSKDKIEVKLVKEFNGYYSGEK